ncbi:MAG: glycosyltransferase family 9 protein [Oscillochloris sp.]|nr:glycosyltransferase family 9 protein [Oscillochloris sp.]
MTAPQMNLPSDIRRIVIFQALFLGDLLMAAPAWHAVRRRFPQAEISLIGLPWTSQILPHMPGLIDRLLPFPGYAGIHEAPYTVERSEQFLQSQRSYGYDLAIQMHGDGNVSNGFVQALGAAASLGYARPGDERLAIALPYNPQQNENLRWLELVAVTGARPVERPVFLKLSPNDTVRARSITPRPPANLPVIGLHVGAKDPIRRWPATRFAALGQELHQRTGAEFVLTGSASERLACKLVRTMIGAPVIDLSARTTIGEFAP